MKARIPKHREFIINLAEDYEKKDECWDKLPAERLRQTEALPFAAHDVRALAAG